MFNNLPDGTYWSCSKSYNGLSKIDKYRPASNRIMDFAMKQLNK